MTPNKRLSLSGCLLSPLVLLPGLVQAQSSSSLTIYGRLNTGLEQVWAHGGVSVTRLNNYRSVVGFKGEEDLGGSLRAIWQIEGALAIDTGAGNAFTNRDTRVGLAGPWGTAFAGVWTLPYTFATSSLDPFYPTTAGYMAIMGNGSASISNNIQDTSSFDRRQVNQFQYWSPTVAGFSARAAYTANEDMSRATGARPWLASGSVSYDANGLTLSTAVERHNEYQARNTADVGVKLGIAYQWGAARMSGVLERLTYETPSGKLARNAAHLSGTYRHGAGTFKLGLSKAQDGTGPSSEVIGSLRSGDRTGASQVTVGYDHELSKRTTLQAFYSQIDNEDRAAYNFAINGADVETGDRPSLVSIGIRHSF